MKKFTGLLFFLLSMVAAFVTLLNLRFLLILLFHAPELDLHAWWVGFGRLCVVFIFGLVTVKAFAASRKRFFVTLETASAISLNSPMQQPAMECDTVVRSTALLTGYWLVFAAALVFAIIAALSIPAFQELFQSFGADLPELTLVVINYRFALFALPLFALILAILLSQKKTIAKHAYRNFKIGLAVFVLLLCATFVTAAVALYLPVFQLGQEIERQ